MPADGSLGPSLFSGSKPKIAVLFAGGGGTCQAFKRVTGYSPTIAINHDPDAIAVHAANHKDTFHYEESVWVVPPRRATWGEELDALWASPDCKDFSRAKGGKPVDRKIRSLAWVVLRWAAQCRPRVIFLENVPEFETWGPLTRSGRRIKARAGETFRTFVANLRALGYLVDWRPMAACDYGAPTTRERLFLVARRDGVAPQWPEPTHGPGRAHPHRTAAECIDLTRPIASIFLTPEEAKAWAKEHNADGVPQRPLSPKTLARIAEGIRRYVLTAARPFVVCLTHGTRLECVDQPLRTITTANGGERAVCVPFLTPVKSWGGGGNDPRSIELPMRTTTTSKGGEHAVAVPVLIQMGYGERDGQAPRALDIDAPLGTIVAGGNHHAVACAYIDKLHGSARAGVPIDQPLPTVSAGGGRGGGHAAPIVAFIAKHNLGVVGHDLNRPLGTVTGIDHHSLVTATLGPAHAAGCRRVAAFLLEYYSSGGQWSALDEPMHTIVTKARMGLVTVEINGEEWAIYDICMRMLEPRELANAQGFDADYQLTGRSKSSKSKAAQIARIGNSVSPPPAEALIRANMPTSMRRAA
jgi:DNA (cytosine-5)-methyltransferase 1